MENTRKGYGKPVFEMSEIDEWEHYYTLYRQLCSFTHLSYHITGKNIAMVAEQNFTEFLTPRFDKKRFLDCVNMWQEITKLAIHLAEMLMEKLGIEYREAFTLGRHFIE